MTEFSSDVLHYVQQELLYDNHLFVNGSKIEESGFSYNYPELTVEVLKEVSFLNLLFPLLFVLYLLA